MWFESMIAKERLVLLLIINLHALLILAYYYWKLTNSHVMLIWTSEYILYELREKRMSTRDVDKCKM